MTAMTAAVKAFEGAPLPDPIRRTAINLMVSRARRDLAAADDDAFARDMEGRPIAEHADAANGQHYELPPTFFEQVLGPRLKYSCGLYPTGAESLAAAERLALSQTCEHAGLENGQSVLELGCGWGSLSLWMAETYPASRIVGVSNSNSQRAFIEKRAQEAGLPNLSAITADMNQFNAVATFDRIVSVEMFEHMSNWRALLERCLGWLKPEGRLFLHVFSHRASPYRFNLADPDDWIAQHFFTGGLMPSHGLIREFSDLFDVEADWRWNGRHYQRTAEDWLVNFDRNSTAIGKVLAEVYGDEAVLWRRRWRLFFLATAGLFGHAGGMHWGVSHYRMRPAARR
jgi:cyclopropane-fatty-acyl-phospholipid synthase